MSIYSELTTTPMGCVVCFNPLATHIRIFPCGCQLPLHDACIPFWKNRGGTCPFCQTTWTPLKAMAHPLRTVPRLSTACKLRFCAALVVVLLLTLAVLLLYYFIAIRQ